MILQIVAALIIHDILKFAVNILFDYYKERCKEVDK